MEEEVGGLVLRLQQSGLTAVPKMILRFNNVHTIRLEKNAIQLTEADITLLARIPTLRVLCLSENDISTVPASIGRLPLKELHLNGNRIHRLPRCLSTMRLDALTLGKNSALPEALQTDARSRHAVERFQRVVLHLYFEGIEQAGQGAALFTLGAGDALSLPPELVQAIAQWVWNSRNNLPSRRDLLRQELVAQ